VELGVSLEGNVFQEKMLRTFGPKRDEIIGGWSISHAEELQNLCSILLG
jgi:hypothetical protein